MHAHRKVVVYVKGKEVCTYVGVQQGEGVKQTGPQDRKVTLTPKFVAELTELIRPNVGVATPR